MPSRRTPRLDAIEARLNQIEQTVEEITAAIAEHVDPRDIPDPDGTTPRQRWQALCEMVAARDGISIDQANVNLLNMASWLTAAPDVD